MNNAISENFHLYRAVALPVIHCINEDQAKLNVDIAQVAGAHGVWLINHGDMTNTSFKKLLSAVLKSSSVWVGANFLGEALFQLWEPAVELDLKGIWTDNACIDGSYDTQLEAEHVLYLQEKVQWAGLYFGGVAFKHQKQPKDVEIAASIAKKYMDVVTTSGPATGEAPSVAKLAAMRAGLGEHALAVASGVTPENVTDFLPYVDAFLVSTGISKDWHNLDLDKTKRLVDIVNSY